MLVELDFPILYGPWAFCRPFFPVPKRLPSNVERATSCPFNIYQTLWPWPAMILYPQEMIQKGRKWPLHLCRSWCTVLLALWKCFAQLGSTFSIPKLFGDIGMCIKKGLYHRFICTRWRASCWAFQRKAYCELTWLEIGGQLLFHARLALLMRHIATSSVCLSRPCYRSGGSPVSLHRLMLGA